MKPEPLLTQRSDALDATALAAAVAGPLRGRIRRIEVFAELPSTNQYLLDADRPAPELADACLAEVQTAGRGRLGRRWHAPLGAGVCLSVAWQFAVAPPRELALLTLALGVAVRRVVADLTGAEIALKWPNDLVHEDRKLGGILVEVSGSGPSGCRIVAGLGLNVALPAEALAAVADSGTRATDLRALTGALPPRTELVLALIEAFAAVFAGYADSGFAPYRDEWQRADGLFGRPIRVQAASGPWLGTAAGIDADGALLVVAADGRRRRVLSDDVSVRVDL